MLVFKEIRMISIATLLSTNYGSTDIYFISSIFILLPMPMPENTHALYSPINFIPLMKIL